MEQDNTILYRILNSIFSFPPSDTKSKTEFRNASTEYIGSQSKVGRGILYQIFLFPMP